MQRLGGDIHRYEVQRPQRLQQQARLAPGAAAELDQLAARPEKRAHVGRMTRHQLQFGPGQVVLWQLSDALD